MFCFFGLVLLKADAKPVSVVFKLDNILPGRLQAAHEQSTIVLVHVGHAERGAAVGIQAERHEIVPHVRLARDRDGLNKDVESPQIAVVIHAAALCGRPAVVRIALLAAAAARLAAARDPPVIVLAALVAELAVRPLARISIAAPARRAALLHLGSPDGLPLALVVRLQLGGLRRRLKIRISKKVITPRHPLRDDRRRKVHGHRASNSLIACAMLDLCG